ncbi:hypothetical protein K458DRAFT_389012 [Lentithecium fluviatile CBS 122367]|uniref:Uncharacterized protein n=1 Tax=Lentithecium fluviatile CBS 122367 TaxID=1168545 RepID=A0A6G1J1Z6_9PLEO|nr:hypothetical protein K458DRAFT_389012 [Lentithecium fluviatile CBS 122367]
MLHEKELLLEHDKCGSPREYNYNLHAIYSSTRKQTIIIWKSHPWILVYIVLLHSVGVLLGAALVLAQVTGAAAPGLRTFDFGHRFQDWIPTEYELQEYGAKDSESKFSSMPNDENIQAWDHLIQATFFSVSQTELLKTGESINDSVLLADGGYMAGLSVYNDIYYLRRLRLFLHSDYYYDTLTETNMKYL